MFCLFDAYCLVPQSFISLLGYYPEHKDSAVAVETKGKYQPNVSAPAILLKLHESFHHYNSIEMIFLPYSVTSPQVTDIATKCLDQRNGSHPCRPFGWNSEEHQGHRERLNQQSKTSVCHIRQS